MNITSLWIRQYCHPGEQVDIMSNGIIVKTTPDFDYYLWDNDKQVWTLVRNVKVNKKQVVVTLKI